MPEGCSRTAGLLSDRNKNGSLCVTAKPVPYEWVSHVLVVLGELHLHSFTLPSSHSPLHCPVLAPVPTMTC